MNFLRFPRPRLLVLAAAFVALPGHLQAVDINVDLDPSGPVAVGQTVTVNLSVSNWNPADGEVDAVSFRVAWDPAFFSFVAGSGTVLNDGTEFLALPSQGGAYSLADDSDDSVVDFGLYLFGATDVGDAAGGSLGPAGPLGSFKLTALNAGSSSVATSNALPSEVFADKSLNGIAPAGGVTFGSLSVTTFTPMTYAIWAAGFVFPLGQGDPDDDPDGDGVNNVGEYGGNMNPLVPDRENLPAFGTVMKGGLTYPSYTYKRPGGTITRSDLTYEHRNSTTLEVWSAAGATVVSTSSPDPVTEMVTVVIRSKTEIGAAGVVRQFLDLKMTL